MKHICYSFLTTHEVAERLGVSESLLKRWRGQGQGPRYVTLGTRLVRYSPADIQTYLDTLARIPCAPAKAEETEGCTDENRSAQ